MTITHLMARAPAALASVLALGAASLAANANTINVPADYPTIQQGVNAASSGDTVLVAAGTYTEQVVINTPITLEGAGQGSTIIQSPTTLTTSFTTSAANYPVVFAAVAGVTIESLTVDGADNGNGNYRFVGIGYYNAGGTIQNVTVQNIEDTPFDGLQGGVAIYAATDSGTNNLTVQNCTLQTYQKNGTVFAGSGLTVSMTGCTVTGAGPTNVIAQNGIEVYGAAGTISGNNVTGNSYTGGYYVATGILPLVTSGHLTVSNNIASGNDVDIYLFNAYGTNTVSQNNLTSTSNGWGIVDGNSAATLSNNTVTGSGSTSIGIEVDAGYGSGPGSGTLTGNTVTGAAYGLYTTGDTSVGGSPVITASGNIFSGNTIDIYNGSPANFNMSANTFDGVNPATATATQLFALEDKIVHGPDNDAYGVVTIVANNLFVTDNSFDPPNTTTVKIQRAINVCAPGNIINLKPGVAFTDNFTINKSCTLSGPQAGVDPGLIAWPSTGLTSITSADNATPPIIINADNVTVQGLVLNVPTSATISQDTSAIALADGRQGRPAATANMQNVHVQFNEILAGTSGDDHTGHGLFLALPNNAASQVFVEHNYLQIGALAPTSAAIFAKGGYALSLTDDYYPSNAGSWVPFTTPDRTVVHYNTLRAHGKVYADGVLGLRVDANNFGSTKPLPGATAASATLLNAIEVRASNGAILNGNLMQNTVDVGILSQSVSGGTAENVIASCNTISGTLTRPNIAGILANPGDPGAGIILGGVQNAQTVGNSLTSNKGPGAVVAGNGYSHFQGVTVTSDPSGNAINAGNLTGNGAKVGINNRTGITIDGTYNWWNSTSGPSFGPGANGPVGPVTTSPYATVISACGDPPVKISLSTPSFNPSTGRFDQTITVQNTSTKNLWMPLFTVSKLNSHFMLYTANTPTQTQYGTVPAGAMAVPMTGPMLANLLAPGQSATLQLEFVQVQPGPISNLKYTADFLSGLLYP